jgi:hypothetical protein
MRKRCECERPLRNAAAGVCELTLAEDLKKQQRNIYSQNGEDGIIDWVFSRITPRHRICVEFGAWDGRNLSNTFNLVAHHGWRAVYIEADQRKFQALRRTAAAYPAIAPVCSIVTASGESSLDHILARHNVPEDFDLLSIDIDGNDYDVWDATVLFHPTLVVIEFNPTFPGNFNYIDRGGREFIGSSAASLNALAARKGYGLLACCGPNLFFLRNTYFAAVGAEPQSVDAALGHKADSYVFLNYAGELVFSDADMAKRVRAVSYARPVKNLVRRALCLPTFYVLGEGRRKDGFILKLLRRISVMFRKRPSAS